jgi:hypothetical protein
VSELDLPGPPAEKSGARQVTEKAIEAVSGSVPFVGGALAVVLAHAFSHSYEKRLRAWMEQLADVVQELIDRVDDMDPETLSGDDDFMDAVATATRIAERNSSEVKRSALQNALLNIGSGQTPDVDKRAVYLRYIDELTPSHMVLLDFFDDPPAFLEARGLPWPNVMMGGLGSVVKVALPRLHADEPFLNTLAGDLSTWGLVSNPGLGTMMTGDGLRAGRTTAKGREFMAFVSGPFSADEASA